MPPIFLPFLLTSLLFYFLPPYLPTFVPFLYFPFQPLFVIPFLPTLLVPFFPSPTSFHLPSFLLYLSSKFDLFLIWDLLQLSFLLFHDCTKSSHLHSRSAHSPSRSPYVTHILYHIIQHCCLLCLLLGSLRMIQVARQEGLNVEQNAAEILVEQVCFTRLLALTPSATLCATPVALPCTALFYPKLPCSSYLCTPPQLYATPAIWSTPFLSLSMSDDISYHITSHHITPTRGVFPFSSPTHILLTLVLHYANFCDLLHIMT